MSKEKKRKSKLYTVPIVLLVLFIGISGIISLEFFEWVDYGGGNLGTSLGLLNAVIFFSGIIVSFIMLVRKDVEKENLSKIKWTLFFFYFFIFLFLIISFISEINSHFSNLSFTPLFVYLLIILAYLILFWSIYSFDTDSSKILKAFLGIYNFIFGLVSSIFIWFISVSVLADFSHL